MKTKLLLLTILITIVSIHNIKAQKLKKFKSTIVKKIGPKEINVPYLHMTSYLEYVDGSNEDAVVEGLKNYYVYIWIPAATTEIGVRMKSPVGKTKIKNAIASADYQNNSGSKDPIDQFISLQRSDIKNPEAIDENSIQNANWTEMYPNAMDTNITDDDDTTEESRFISKTDDPLNVLSRGLYRISFQTYNHEGVKGTFLGQIGFPIKLPGVVISRNIEDLKRELLLK
ncbi:LipL32 family surface lipoprotein [Aquimarina sp. 2201CG14-23]|uniref:LipL32 family surface lipoprotein n=1 Tax=Aquimarina mycalae TaxID=3040073 RepID=UPI002477CEDB|nr:LipL32 family surface lipoprotein [Aquimarina sp. 2201CG14-23]MDH7444933.1 LipL32 family surface lipoprotein [Aquimarina sp. 2201CG14-23]